MWHHLIKDSGKFMMKFVPGSKQLNELIFVNFYFPNCAFCPQMRPPFKDHLWLRFWQCYYLGLFPSWKVVLHRLRCGRFCRKIRKHLCFLVFLYYCSISSCTAKLFSPDETKQGQNQSRYILFICAVSYCHCIFIKFLIIRSRQGHLNFWRQWVLMLKTCTVHK